MRQRLIVLLVLLAGVAAGRSAESRWSVRVWRAEGLPEKTVTGLGQARSRVFWLSTPQFLARFDGAAFESFHRSTFAPALSGNIQSILGTRDGGLCAAIGGEVVCLRSNRVSIFSCSAPEDPVRSLIEDSEGAIWSSYDSGRVCRILNGTVTSFAPPAVSAEGTGCSLASDGEGTVWFANGRWVGVFADGKFRPLERFPSSPRIRIAGRRAGGVWVFARSHLYEFSPDGKIVDRGSLGPKLVNPRIASMLEDSSGAVWIGTRNQGLFRFHDSRVEEIPISHAEVTCLWEDHEGSLWAGTDGGGLNRIRPDAVTVEGGEAGLPGQSLLSLTEDSQGVLWASAKDGTLVLRTNGRWNPVSLPATASRNASCVASDPAGGVWIGTGNFALHQMRGGGFTSWLKQDGLRSHTARALFANGAGEVWIGGEGLISLQVLRQGRLETCALPASAGCLRTMVEDAEGNLWAGGDRGTLIRARGGLLTDQSSLGPPGGKSIRCLRSLSNGDIWMTFDGGFGRIRDGKLGVVRAEQGLPDGRPAQLLADDRGWFWFTSPSGLFKVRLRELEEAVTDPSRNVHPVRIQEALGLQPDPDQAAAALRSRDRRLWFPMGTALVIVRPDLLRDQSEPSPVLVTRLAVDDRTVATWESVMPVPAGSRPLGSAPLDLSPKHHRVEFAFTTLSFSAPENVHFRYRLEGLEEGWTEAGPQRRASYSRLGAGRYRFHVKACNSDGVWNEEGAAVAFVVAPFLWQRWWFQGVLFAGFATAMIALGRYVSFRRWRSRLQVIEQQAALDRERTRIARDLHDDLGSRLTEILLLSRRALREPDANVRVQQIEAKARLGIKSLDETVWAVNPANDTLAHLVNYVAQFAVTFLQAAGIRFRLEAPPDLPNCALPVEVRHHLLLVIKEGLNNAVRHAEAAEVRLAVAVSDAGLEMVIEDNGKGFLEPPADDMADGLRNMRQRMEEIGGRFRVESKPGAGTRIFLFCGLPPR